MGVGVGSSCCSAALWVFTPLGDFRPYSQARSQSVIFTGSFPRKFRTIASMCAAVLVACSIVFAMVFPTSVQARAPSAYCLSYKRKRVRLHLPPGRRAWLTPVEGFAQKSHEEVAGTLLIRDRDRFLPDCSRS